MMNRWAIPLVFVIVAFIGVACGSSSTTSEDSALPSEPERVDPTATPVPSPTTPPKQPDPTATPIPSPYAPARPYCYPGD